MRRYSEIPNTPTPYSKRSQQEFKIGSIVTIINTGRAVLRYIGPIEGKIGEFAGVELLGESVVRGKNSGDVNGISYFKTKQPGAGLFMALEKLKNSIEYIESPASSRLSTISSPGISFNATPSRSNTSSAIKPYQTPGLVSAVKKHHISTQLKNTPQSNVALTQSVKSPLEKEIQRLNSTKLVIENERDALLKQSEDLKAELQVLNRKLSEDQKIMENLQMSLEQRAKEHDALNERATVAENKLIKQRRIYETQKKELLEAIDQVEAQVNDNEQLYIGELKKLQEELTQKQQIIEDLTQKEKDLNDLYEKQKSSSNEEVHDQELKNEINNLKLTNLTQSKAIEHLRQDLKEREERIVELNTKSLALKETHISENELLREQTDDYKKRIDSLTAIIDQKEQEILTIKSESSSPPVTKDITDKEDTIRSLETEVKELKLKVTENETLEKKIQELNDVIDDLRSNTQSNDLHDKVQELEFKLENKESIIESLKLQLSEQEHTTTADTTEKDTEIQSLKEEMQSKSKKIEELEREIESSKSKATSEETLQKQVEEKSQLILKLESQIEELKASQTEVQDLSPLLAEKDLEIQSISKKLEDLDIKATTHEKELVSSKSLLQQAEDEARLIKEEREALKKELSTLNELKSTIDQLKQENDTLQQTIVKKTEELEEVKVNSATQPTQTTQSPEQVSDSVQELLEEKTLEIELLKEEILQLKNDDAQKEITSLRKKLEETEVLNKSTTNNELNEQIKLLQKELDARPTISELQELRSELELIDDLRRVESRTKDKEIQDLKNKLKVPSPKTKTPEIKRQASAAGRTSMGPLSLNRPPVISQVVDGALQVYVPDLKKDPANGRATWCGLCERSGHDSIDCPYDNEIF